MRRGASGGSWASMAAPLQLISMASRPTSGCAEQRKAFVHRLCSLSCSPSNAEHAQSLAGQQPACQASALHPPAPPACHRLTVFALQSYGRTQERNATCKTYIGADAGCGASWPTLAGVSSSNTKWIFDPVPGGSIYRWYIRMNVRAAAELCTRAATWQPLAGFLAVRSAASGVGVLACPLTCSLLPLKPLCRPAWLLAASATTWA
jgi:hypothetical protein